MRELLTYFFRHRARPHGVAWHWWASVYHDTVSRLHRIQAPTLVFQGEEDRLSPLANSELLATRIPDAELAVVPGAGHAYALERPEESFELFRKWYSCESPIAAGRRPQGMAARAEPLTRAFGLQVGALRTGRSLAALAAQLPERRRSAPPSESPPNGELRRAGEPRPPRRPRRRSGAGSASGRRAARGG